MRKRKVLLMAVVVLLLMAGVCAFCQRDEQTAAPAGSSSAALGLVLLDDERCVHVLAVTDQSPADYAGFQPGDYILRTDSVPVENTEAFEQLLEKGKTLECLVRRGEQELRLEIPFR